MRPPGLLESWRDEERAPFTGWDFSHISARAIEDEPPWSYDDLARDAMRGRQSVLDLGTGGGEVLSRLRDAYPPHVVATEAYAPNVGVARDRLAPLGVTVVPYVADEVNAPIPFAAESFDVILSRHEAYDPREIARVLTPGGVFLTQQVDGDSLAELQAWFGMRPQWPDVRLAALRAPLEQSGLVIEEAREWRGVMTFTDVGAIVYLLRAIPWEVPGFSVERHRDALLRLDDELQRRGGRLRFAIGRFVLRARKPKR